MKKFILCILVLLLTVMTCSAALAAGTAVKSIQLNASSVTLSPGSTYQLKATVKPANAANKKITYTTSNSKVATVTSAGKITVVGCGTCTITAKSNNGKTAKMSVNVPQPAVTKVTLNTTSVNMLGSKVTLKATCQPNGSNQKVTWSSNNTKVATVSSSGVVTPKGYGTCTITAKSKNGVTAACTVTVKKDNKITKSYTVGEEWPYLMKDTFTIVVDGLTGKITSTDCYQTKRDASVGGVIVKEGIKAFNTQKTYVEFRSTYTIKIGVGLGKLNFGVEALTKTNQYRMDNQGNLKVIKNSCSDLLGLCRQ